jgi:hypothetical protein
VRPILTTDKLLKSRTDLTALIHSRTVFGLRERLPIDAQLVAMAWRSGASQLPFLEGCVVIHGPDFGQIKA